MRRHLLALLAVGLAMAAQAHAQTPDDPYEKLNRRIFDASMAADRKYFLPVARRFHALTPGILGLAIHNFVTNLSEPIVVGNDILQFRLKRGANDLARLITNTTFGLGGVIDLAKRQGLPHRDNDFGVTLGVWGAKPGPYLFLPFVGSSDLRDAIGLGVDAVAAPLNWVRFPGRLTLQYTTGVVGAFDSRIRSEDELQAELSGATDPYATIRSDYLQSREAMIRGEEAPPILPPLDDASPPAGSAPADSGEPHAAISAPSPALASADAVAIAPTGGPSSAAAAQVASADDDPEAAIVTAQPCDRDPVAPATRLAGL
ncbi:MAG TPA: MlaA family lipoprotein [Caulobacteraceae bacterium]|nr:MlaA family lipoprotein [Caulobacteraceae bacterium]